VGIQIWLGFEYGPASTAMKLSGVRWKNGQASLSYWPWKRALVAPSCLVFSPSNHRLLVILPLHDRASSSAFIMGLVMIRGIGPRLRNLMVQHHRNFVGTCWCERDKLGASNNWQSYCWWYHKPLQGRNAPPRRRRHRRFLRGSSFHL